MKILSIQQKVSNIIKSIKKELKPKGPKYPKTVEEVIDDELKYKKGTIDAILKFKASNPWKGSLKETVQKYQTLNQELSAVYKVQPPTVVFLEDFFCGSCYFPVGNLIVMVPNPTGKYGVCTFLHEFGHSLYGPSEKQACRWSINLFKRYFPEQYSKLEPVGHLLFTKKTIEKINETIKN